jgi:pilus assembly protein CpaE
LSQLLAVYSTTGGVGRTTVAVNLAVALRRARPESRVCLVDLDLQFGDVEMHVDLPALGAPTIHDLAIVDDPAHVDDELVASVLRLGPMGVHVLAAPPLPELADAVEHVKLVRILDLLRSRHDYVVADCGSHLGEVALTALELAHRVVLVAGTDLPSARGLRKALDVTHAVDGRPGRVMLVVNQRDPHADLPAEPIATIAGLSPAAVLPHERAVVTSVNLGCPVVLSAPSCAVSQALLRLGREIAGVGTPGPRLEPDGVTARLWRMAPRLGLSNFGLLPRRGGA